MHVQILMDYSQVYSCKGQGLMANMQEYYYFFFASKTIKLLSCYVI